MYFPFHGWTTNGIPISPRHPKILEQKADALQSAESPHPARPWCLRLVAIRRDDRGCGFTGIHAQMQPFSTATHGLGVSPSRSRSSNARRREGADVAHRVRAELRQLPRHWAPLRRSAATDDQPPFRQRRDRGGRRCSHRTDLNARRTDFHAWRQPQHHWGHAK